MSMEISPSRARVEISNEWINAVAIFFAAVMILIAPASAQDPYPGGHEISGYVTYGASGLPGVWVVGVGTGESTGYLGFDITDFAGYYNIPVPEGFAGNVEAFESGYTFDPPSRYYSNVVSDKTNQNFALLTEARLRLRRRLLSLLRTAARAGSSGHPTISPGIRLEMSAPMSKLNCT